MLEFSEVEEAVAVDLVGAVASVVAPEALGPPDLAEVVEAPGLADLVGPEDPPDPTLVTVGTLDTEATVMAAVLSSLVDTATLTETTTVIWEAIATLARTELAFLKTLSALLLVELGNEEVSLPSSCASAYALFASFCA